MKCTVVESGISHGALTRSESRSRSWQILKENSAITNSRFCDHLSLRRELNRGRPIKMAVNRHSSAAGLVWTASGGAPRAARALRCGGWGSSAHLRFCAHLARRGSHAAGPPLPVGLLSTLGMPSSTDLLLTDVVFARARLMDSVPTTIMGPCDSVSSMLSSCTSATGHQPAARAPCLIRTVGVLSELRMHLQVMFLVLPACRQHRCI